MGISSMPKLNLTKTNNVCSFILGFRKANSHIAGGQIKDFITYHPDEHTLSKNRPKPAAYWLQLC